MHVFRIAPNHTELSDIIPDEAHLARTNLRLLWDRSGNEEGSTQRHERLVVGTKDKRFCDVTFQRVERKARVVIYDYQTCDVVLNIVKPVHEALSVLARHLNGLVAARISTMAHG